MLCSEQELGLSDSGEGILVLPASFAPHGTLLVDAEPSVRDTVLEIGLTPNRPDGLGHVGLARELAALFDLPFEVKPPPMPQAEGVGDVGTFVQVAIEDGERCPHYGAAVLIDANVGPSPLWLRYRLAALGVRAISNVVDITNLVMLEYGHPMHAFDLDKVRGGRIVVRRAREGEKLRTLDGVDRTLSADDLVICDGEGPVALAGVMGGGDSEISASTRRVLLECAYFEPRGVRRASRRHGLHTESSHRFERGVDPGDTAGVLAASSAYVTRLAGGRAAAGQLMAIAKPIEPRTVSLRPKRLAQLLGVEVPREEAVGILGRLGITKTGGTADADTFQIPTHRPDISREVDLIEEVVRVRGFETIPSELPAIRPSRDAGPREALVSRTRAAAVALGLSEALTYSFVSPQTLKVLGAPTPTVVLKNPLHDQRTVMRTSLLPGLLDALANARRRGEWDVRLFTVGPLFLEGDTQGGLPEERLTFAALLAGGRPQYLARPVPVDVWDAKGLAEGLVTRLLRRTADIQPLSPAPTHLHPRGAARITVEGVDVGVLGPLHPDVIDALDLGGEAIVVEINLQALEGIGIKPARYEPLPRFPAATRDVALVVRDEIPAGEVVRAIREAAGALAEDVTLFDRFVGGAVPTGHASLAFHVVYRAPDRTLTDTEVDAQHAKLIEAVNTRFGATLRA
jgi:phenylalanyl-tRNA synthetase beta chain